MALDAERSFRASVGFSCVVVLQFLGVVKEPSDVDGCGAEAKHQTHKFTGALEQGG